ncbi:CGNR zinc finger domain-containing protein [Roseibium sp. AS2]|uniref:CGNR zinc finger domain-containing protein n=1 Tax=Roseibium sp. AS2 TaxID=3135781 RepID=UPI00317AF005
MTTVQTLPPMLIADHPALDFLNSVGAPFGEEIEWLATGECLLDWLAASGLMAQDQADKCRKNFARTDLDTVARQAIALREWFRTFLIRQSEFNEWSLDDDDFNRINGFLGKAVHVFRLHPASPGDDERKNRPELSGSFAFDSPEDLLALLALNIAEFVSVARLNDTRNCAGETCTMWFVDLTKNKKRRWCDMKICGNRAKAAAFRERQVKT